MLLAAAKEAGHSISSTSTPSVQSQLAMSTNSLRQLTMFASLTEVLLGLHLLSSQMAAGTDPAFQSRDLINSTQPLQPAPGSQRS